MSLFSTIAHDGPVPARQFGPIRKGIAAVALAVAVGLAVAALSPTGDLSDSTLRAIPGVLTNAQFVQLNTVALDNLTPSAGAVIHDSFVYWNVDALEGFTPSLAASRVDFENDDFLYWNIDSIGYTPGHAQSPSGPR